MKNLYMITGFLGSGKTTFLTEVVKAFQHEKIAVIVNEFGAVGVDGAVLKSQGIESYEITNGSIFCVCRKDLFIDALKMANDLEIDTIIVETSGLSDPLTSDDVLKLTKQIYGVEFNFKGIVSLIDAKNFLKVLKTAVCIENQVKAADLFVINKCDLVEDLTEVKKAIINLNSDAKIIETTYGKINCDEFLNLEHQKRDGFIHKKDLILQKKLFEFETELDLERFLAWLRTFKDDAYRIKGFIHTNKGNFNIECVLGSIDLHECEYRHEKSFVVVLYNARQLKFASIQTYSGD